MELVHDWYVPKHFLILYKLCTYASQYQLAWLELTQRALELQQVNLVNTPVLVWKPCHQCTIKLNLSWKKMFIFHSELCCMSVVTLALKLSFHVIAYSSGRKTLSTRSKKCWACEVFGVYVSLLGAECNVCLCICVCADWCWFRVILNSAPSYLNCLLHTCRHLFSVVPKAKQSTETLST